MQRYLTAIFEDRERAEAAIRDLQATDIPAEEISIALGRHHHRNLIERLGMSDTPLVTDSNVEGQEAHHVTETGMKTGASIGSVVGLIAGIPLILATGGGAGLLVAGAIAGVLGGGVAGAAAGGLTGALIGMGMSHRQAEDVHRRVERGAVVVSLRAPERYMDDIERIFSHHGLDEVVITALGGAVK